MWISNVRSLKGFSLTVMSQCFLKPDLLIQKSESKDQSYKQLPPTPTHPRILGRNKTSVCYFIRSLKLRKIMLWKTSPQVGGGDAYECVCEE